MKTIISLGAGVQSSTLALMAAKGELETPDAAIFADTGAEPKAVYKWLNELEGLLPFPVYRVQKDSGLLKNIKESIEGGRFASAPFYTESESKTGGTLRRQCTGEFKVDPITQKIRSLVGLEKGEKGPRKKILVTQWIGISLDEMQRMKESKVKWIKNTWPLIDLRMSRHDCLAWMDKNGYPAPPKSACTFCPYHNDALWRQIKTSDPESWKEAVEVDRMIRDGVRGTNQQLFLHQSLIPLEDVDFRNETDHGQLDLFNNECEGMCGV